MWLFLFLRAKSLAVPLTIRLALREDVDASALVRRKPKIRNVFIRMSRQTVICCILTRPTT